MTLPERRVLVLGTKSARAGAPIAALRLAAGLADCGYQAEAWFLYDPDPVQGGDYPYTALVGGKARGAADTVRIVMRLWREMRRFRPDVVVTFLPFASVLGSLIARLAGVPVRIVSHRVPCNTYSRIMRPLDRMSAVIGNYTDVVAVSASVAQSCAGYPAWLKARTHVVYNGLKDWPRSGLTRSQARERLGLPVDSSLVVAVGRLAEQKNYPVLIDAMRDTPRQLVLAVAGEGPDRPALEQQISDNGLEERIILLGSIAREEIPHLLAAADAFAQPSLFEGQSNALLEALHAGLPCLVSDAPEQVETVTNDAGDVAGAVLPTHDAAAWREALVTFATQPPSPGMLTTIRRQSELFTFDRMMKGFVDAIEQALRR